MLAPPILRLHIQHIFRVIFHVVRYYPPFLPSYVLEVNRWQIFIKLFCLTYRQARDSVVRVSDRAEIFVWLQIKRFKEMFLFASLPLNAGGLNFKYKKTYSF
jgi:hypothetical protein